MRYNPNVMTKRKFQRRNSTTQNFPDWYIPNPTLPTHPEITDDTNEDVQKALLLSIIIGSRRLNSEEFTVCLTENFPRLNQDLRGFVLTDIAEDKKAMAQSIIEEITTEATDSDSEIFNIS
jgi:hypothetical protein